MRIINPLTRRTATAARPHSEAGSAVVEAVIGIPIFLMLVSIVAFGGRVAITHQSVQSAASDAARAASLARTATAAKAAAANAASYTLANQGLTCVTTHVTTDVGGFQVPVGRPASVTVTVGCTVRLDDLGIPGAPATRLVSATMSSALDTYRGR